MLREYELTVITKADLSEKDTEKLFNRYENLMAKDGGEILKKSSWGLKKLAYPIKKQFRGYYTFYDFAGDTDNLSEIERLMRIDEGVLRYLSVKINDHAPDLKARRAELEKGESVRAPAVETQDDETPSEQP